MLLVKVGVFLSYFWKFDCVRSEAFDMILHDFAFTCYTKQYFRAVNFLVMINWNKSR